jgi:hypothetical protein
MRLNVEKNKFYTLRELDAVSGSLENDTAMRKVLREVQRTYDKITADRINSVGQRLGLESAAAAVNWTLEANRRKNEVPVASDDDTITIGELREAIRRDGTYWLTSIPTIDATVDKLAKSIFDAREPDWKPGDVVKDADGRFWKRTFGGKHHAWAAFETAMYQPFDIPKRPLEKIS